MNLTRARRLIRDLTLRGRWQIEGTPAGREVLDLLAAKKRPPRRVRLAVKLAGQRRLHTVCVVVAWAA